MNNKQATEILEWWEKKRVWYNLIVLLIGIWQIIMEKPEVFGFADIKWIVVYGLGANFCFSLGILIEFLDEYYFKTFFKFKRFRWLFLIVGTIFSVLYTTLLINICFHGPLWAL